MDRDSTFQIVTKDGNKVDLPADVVEEAYAKTLYEKLNPGKKYDPTKIDAGEYLADGPRDTNQVYQGVLLWQQPEEKLKSSLRVRCLLIRRWQSTWANDARQADEILSDLTIARPANCHEELVDYAEGMRQTTKQARNQLSNAMKAAEVDHIPFTLNRGLTIMERWVRNTRTNRTFSPADAENALAQIGMTPAKVSEELGNYYSYVLKLGSTKIYSNTAEGVGFAMSQTAGQVVIGGGLGLGWQQSRPLKQPHRKTRPVKTPCVVLCSLCFVHRQR